MIFRDLRQVWLNVVCSPKQVSIGEWVAVFRNYSTEWLCLSYPGNRLNPIGDITRISLRMPNDMPIGAGRFAALRRLMIRTGIGLIVVSVFVLVLAIAGVMRADSLAVGGNSGLRMIAAVAILGCLMAAIGYWDDYERS